MDKAKAQCCGHIFSPFRLVTALECSNFSRSQYFREFVQTRNLYLCASWNISKLVSI